MRKQTPREGGHERATDTEHLHQLLGAGCCPDLGSSAVTEVTEGPFPREFQPTGEVPGIRGCPVALVITETQSVGTEPPHIQLQDEGEEGRESDRLCDHESRAEKGHEPAFFLHELCVADPGPLACTEVSHSEHVQVDEEEREEEGDEDEMGGRDGLLGDEAMPDVHVTLEEGCREGFLGGEDPDHDPEEDDQSRMGDDETHPRAQTHRRHHDLVERDDGFDSGCFFWQSWGYQSSERASTLRSPSSSPRCLSCPEPKRPLPLSRTRIHIHIHAHPHGYLIAKPFSRQSRGRQAVTRADTASRCTPDGEHACHERCIFPSDLSGMPSPLNEHGSICTCLPGSDDGAQSQRRQA